VSARPRGHLLALEGIDGAGKSTLAKELVLALKRRGIRVVARREPTDRPLGQLAQEAARRDPWTGAVYFTIDRCRARPALERDLTRASIVITDRSFYSTLAYQGSALGRGGVEQIEELSAKATIAPDRVVLLDLPVPVALARLGLRGAGRGPLERRKTLERVARRYRAMARRGDWILLDARRPISELVQEVLDALGSWLRPASQGRRGPALRRRT
jgi:dTMP kinase